jgi:hypothetical protein
MKSSIVGALTLYDTEHEQRKRENNPHEPRHKLLPLTNGLLRALYPQVNSAASGETRHNMLISKDMNRPFSIVLAAVLVATLSHPRDAQGQSAALQRRLAAATRLDCRFSALVTTSWNDKTPNATVAATEFEASFFDVNVAEGTAEADSRFGPSFIVARYAFGYLHLMQISDAGPLYVTTVIATETTGGRMIAVHVRNEYSPAVLPGFTSRPEMYVGDCEVSDAPAE